MESTQHLNDSLRWASRRVGGQQGVIWLIEHAEKILPATFIMLPPWPPIPLWCPGLLVMLVWLRECLLCCLIYAWVSQILCYHLSSWSTDELHISHPKKVIPSYLTHRTSDTCGYVQLKQHSAIPWRLCWDAVCTRCPKEIDAVKMRQQKEFQDLDPKITQFQISVRTMNRLLCILKISCDIPYWLQWIWRRRYNEILA